VIYVYAIAEREAPAPSEPGLGGAPVERLAEGELAAFVTHDPPGGVEPSAETLWEHEGVVERLMRSGPVLPMRFGSVVREEGALRDLLADRAPEFERSLERVRGRVELGLRALARLDVPEPDEGSGTGRRYLHQKLGRRRAAQGIADQLHPSFAELAVTSTRRLLPADGVAFAGAYLVGFEHVAEFERRARRIDRECAHVELVCTGPWPPYSFTREPDA
jgi:hypothetical protein